MHLLSHLVSIRLRKEAARDTKIRYLHAVFTPVVQACLKLYTATRRSLHAFDLMRLGYSDSVCNVSRVTSSSSSDIRVTILFGSTAIGDSAGGVIVVGEDFATLLDFSDC